MSPSHADGVARAIGLCKYLVEHERNDYSRPDLLVAINVCRDRLDELGGAEEIPEFEPSDPRIDPTTVRSVVIALDRVQEDVGPGESKRIDRVQTILDEHQKRMQEVAE